MFFKIKGFRNAKYKTNKYVIIPIYLFNIRDKKNVIAYIKRELYIVDKLYINILIVNNIINFKEIVLNIAKSEV